MTTEEAKKIFICDTNVLIRFSVWVPITLNGFFWSALEKALEDGKWTLLDVVVNEIKYEGDLKKWCKQQEKKGLVKKISSDDRNRAVEINNTYKMIDEITKKSTVDTYLVAYAEKNKLVVFSEESPRVNNTQLYKIPDVCSELKIERTRKPEVFLKAIGFKN